MIMKKYIAGCALMMVLFSACEKKVDPIDGNNAAVTLVNAGTNYVTGDITVNPKDSIFFSFTVTSNTDMGFVGIQKNPVNQTAFLVRDTLNSANKNSYTAVKKFAADSINGSFIYRIAAHTANGIYIGHKDIIVTVKPDYNYYIARVLQVPDTTTKVNTCYMAAATGTTYSYTTGAANSASIDFGFYYDTLPANKFSVYSLSTAQPQLAYYDISSWTKNVTIMKKASSPAFNTLTSGGALRTAGITNLSSGTSNKITALASGNLVYFKTAAGKVGCMQVLFVNGSSPAKDSYINVEIKIEK